LLVPFRLLPTFKKSLTPCRALLRGHGCNLSLGLPELLSPQGYSAETAKGTICDI